MKPALRKAFNAEMGAAIALYQAGQLAEAFRHLEVAHVLGQRHVGPHVVNHYWMLKVGIKRHSMSEVVGQMVRILLGAVSSAVGIVPVGNTGGTNVGMFKRLPIDPGIEHLMR